MNPLDTTDPGFDDMAMLDMSAAPTPDRGPGQASVREAANRRRLRARFLRAGREAVDDRELLELLLTGCRGITDTRALAAGLLEVFGTAPRALAVRPAFASYDKVIAYCRTLAGHREVEQFHLLFLDRKNRLIADELHQQGSVCHTPAYPREICIRALELQASAIVAVHAHPSGDPEPSRADIDMTGRIRDALKTVGVTLLDHVIVTPTASASFRTRGLL